MPDYSNTFIYKLCCNDPTVTDIYVGHTTNLTKRKSHHKSTVNKDTHKEYNYYKSVFIRDHGGWINWSMIVIEKVACECKYDAERIERHYIELLKATLNKQIPTRTGAEYRVENADILKQKYIDNSETLRAIGREKYKNMTLEQKEAHRLYNKEWRTLNKVKLAESKKIYNENNKLEIKEKKRKYYLDNQEYFKEKARNITPEQKEENNRKLRDRRHKLKELKI